MTDATCTPSSAPVSLLEREARPDRLAELLEWLADLLIEVRQQRAALGQAAAAAGAAAQEGVERLSWLEDRVRGIGMEAASIQQLLQHEQLI